MTDTINVNVGGKQYTLAKWAAILFGIAFVVLAAWVIWKDHFRPVERAGQTVEAAPAKEVKGLPTEAAAIAGGAVQALPDSVKPKLNLPAAVAGNRKKRVIAASKIKASDRPHTVTTLIDTDTGKAETYVRTDPLPWLAFRSSGAAGIGYGFRSGGMVARAYIRQDLIQVKALVLTGTVSADRMMSTGKAEASAVMAVEYRW